MKIVSRKASQGDVKLIRVDCIPAEAVEVKRQPGEPIVVTHSETEHHHVIGGAVDTKLFTTPSPLVCYLSVNDPYVDVEHLRTWDTHETLRLLKGMWEIRRQREHTPEGWRQVAD